MEELSVMALVVGVTQLVKDTGYVKGQTLKAVAVIVGGLATYVNLYEPALWENLTGVLMALSATGLVSFGKNLKK